MSLNLNNIFPNLSEAVLVSKLICFEDNRLHVAFDDQTSLIIHQGNGFYFE